MNNRDEFVKSLLEMAWFYEGHPDMPLPSQQTFYVWGANIKEVPKVALQMAPCSKEYTDSFFNMTKKFGERIILQYTLARDSVCKRVQVGTRLVPEQVIPAYEQPVYEWDCGEKSVLKSGTNQLEENTSERSEPRTTAL
jgi:hypothetical protein